jgi:hypothetical protein
MNYDPSAKFFKIKVNQDQVIIRPTVSRPVRLGVGPPLEQMTRLYIYFSDNYFLSFQAV